MMKKFAHVLALFTVALLSSCKKDETTTTTTTTNNNNDSKGSIVLVFEAKSDTSNLVFGKKYVNDVSDTFTVSKFNYFISNVSLLSANNEVITETESYHLVRHINGSKASFTISGIPYNTYKTISFTLGVDSARNVSGVQKGDLDPSNSSDMYWSWSTGYIFLKLEGTSPKSGATDKSYEFHIGGFGGVNKTQRNFQFNFTSVQAEVKENASPTITFKSNVNEVFSKPTSIDLKTKYNILSIGANSKMVADNYADMISLQKVQNN